MYKYLNKLEYEGKYVDIYCSDIFNKHVNKIGEELDKKIPQIISFFAIKNYNGKFQVNLYDNENDYRNFVEFDLNNSKDAINLFETSTNNMYTSYDLLEKRNDDYYLVDPINGNRTRVTNTYTEFKVAHILELFIEVIYNKYLNIKPNRYWMIVGLQLYLSGINNKSTDTEAFIRDIDMIIDEKTYYSDNKHYSYKVRIYDSNGWVQLDNLSKEILEDRETDPLIYSLCYVCVKYLFNKYSRRNILTLLLDDSYYNEKASNNKIIEEIEKSYYDSTLPQEFFFTPRRKNVEVDRPFYSYNDDVNEYNGLYDEEELDEYSDLEEDLFLDDEIEDLDILDYAELLDEDDEV